MARTTTVLITTLIAILLALLLGIQLLIAQSLFQAGLPGTPALSEVPAGYTLLRVGSFAFIACVQIVLVCVWKLVTLAQRGKIFHPDAFSWVNVALGAVCAATALVIAGTIASLLTAYGMAVATTLVGVIFALFGLGLTLIILVMRSLLHQATQLQTELAEVV